MITNRKIKQKKWISHAPPPHAGAQPPHYRCPQQTECATVHEALGTRRLRPEPTVYSRVTVGVIHCMDSDQDTITWVPSASIIHRRLTALQIRTAPPVHPSLPN